LRHQRAEHQQVVSRRERPGRHSFQIATPRLAKIAQIRKICEDKLTSRTLAFTWTLRAFDLDPENDALYADVLRLASEIEQWREIATVFEKHASNPNVAEATRLKLFRELAKIASRRLNDHERARGYHRSVLGITAEDRDAEQHLEEVAIQLHDWPELLASYRRRVARGKDPMERASLLIEIASLQEEKLVDLDGASATYHEALATLPGQLRALRAVARIEEARGDWDALVRVLASELEQTPDGQPKFDLLMRIGGLEELQLEQPSQALARYRDALAVSPAPRPQAVVAIARLTLGASSKLEAKERVAAARLILPHLEAQKQVARDREKQQKRVKELEGLIAAGEKQLAEMRSKLREDPGGDWAKLAKLAAEEQAVAKRVDAMMAEWARLSDG
jgi:hypothetical protein